MTFDCSSSMFCHTFITFFPPIATGARRSWVAWVFWYILCSSIPQNLQSKVWRSTWHKSALSGILARIRLYVWECSFVCAHTIQKLFNSNRRTASNSCPWQRITFAKNLICLPYQLSAIYNHDGWNSTNFGKTWNDISRHSFIRHNVSRPIL